MQELQARNNAAMYGGLVMMEMWRTDWHHGRSPGTIWGRVQRTNTLAINHFHPLRASMESISTISFRLWTSMQTADLALLLFAVPQ
jgi:hypothetical protein